MDLTAARRAHSFAQQHDWGHDSSLGQMADGSYRICGLVDAWTQREPDGSVSYHESRVTLPATVAAMRDFGNY